jgi:hypothetical protein
MDETFDNQYANINIKKINNKLYIKGFIKSPNNFKNKAIIAPNPMDTITSYSGKGLPFPCEAIAFENTPNFFKISDNGTIDVIFYYPNSYYSVDGYTKIKSPVIIYLDDIKIIIELKDSCPLKTLRDRIRGNPSFYGLKELILPIGNAEDVMNNYSTAKLLYNIA